MRPPGIQRTFTTGPSPHSGGALHRWNREPSRRIQNNCNEIVMECNRSYRPAEVSHQVAQVSRSRNLPALKNECTAVARRTDALFASHAPIPGIEDRVGKSKKDPRCSSPILRCFLQMIENRRIVVEATGVEPAICTENTLVTSIRRTEFSWRSWRSQGRVLGTLKGIIVAIIVSPGHSGIHGGEDGASDEWDGSVAFGLTQN